MDSCKFPFAYGNVMYCIKDEETFAKVTKLHGDMEKYLKETKIENFIENDTDHIFSDKYFMITNPARLKGKFLKVMENFLQISDSLDPNNKNSYLFSRNTKHEIINKKDNKKMLIQCAFDNDNCYYYNINDNVCTNITNNTDKCGTAKRIFFGTSCNTCPPASSWDLNSDYDSIEYTIKMNENSCTNGNDFRLSITNYNCIYMDLPKRDNLIKFVMLDSNLILSNYSLYPFEFDYFKISFGNNIGYYLNMTSDLRLSSTKGKGGSNYDFHYDKNNKKVWVNYGNDTYVLSFGSLRFDKKCTNKVTSKCGSESVFFVKDTPDRVCSRWVFTNKGQLRPFGNDREIRYLKICSDGYAGLTSNEADATMFSNE